MIYRLLDYLANRADEGRMRPHRSSSFHLNAAFGCHRGGFSIEIVDHFHVIREESDGNNHQAL